jgi:hypothetical protein
MKRVLLAVYPSIRWKLFVELVSLPVCQIEV